MDITFEELFTEETAATDQDRANAMKRLELLVRDLPAGQIDKLADIIQSILEFP